jgi:hypothetical protein
MSVKSTCSLIATPAAIMVVELTDHHLFGGDTH